MRARAALGLVGALLGAALASAPAHAMSTAFYYGPSVPPELWQAYDQVVVEPEHVPQPDSVEPRRARAVAYLSVGEIARVSRLAAGVQAGWVLGDNPGWASWVMDPTQPGYRAYLLARYEALWSAGYTAFFLDTLDSYALVARDAVSRERARRGLVSLIRELAARHPGVGLLLNRGFELLPELAPLVQGVVAESLFDRWDPGARRYAPVPEPDRAWLLQRLREVRERYGLPVTVIDYRPLQERAAARETARRIAALGFEPWVADSALSSVGVGEAEILPRRVLVLTDGDGAAAALLAPIIEYLGYVPEPRDIAAHAREGDVAGRYQGVVTWLSRSAPAGYGAWLRAQVAAGERVAMFGAPGFDLAGPEARALGVEVLGPASASATQVSARDELIGFEAEPPARPLEVARLCFVGPAVRRHLVLADARGETGTVIATAAWGGAALSHVFATRGLAGERAWVLDPFEFLTRALDLPEVPQPDVTTEHGRRVALWLVRAAGLGAASRLPGRPPISQVLSGLWREQRWPHALDLGPGLDAAAASRALPPSERAPQPWEAALSTEDRARAEALAQLPFVEHAAVPAGLTDAGAAHASLTHVQGLSSAGGVPGPIAPAWSFLPPNSPEAYPYARVKETLAFTDAPRRLKPILLDYPASVAASPGGFAALAGLYRWLAGEEIYPLALSEYVARVHAFREAVLLRHLDGSLELVGGDALRTLRLPARFGSPDLLASPTVASFRRLPQGQYVTFAASGPRRLVASAHEPTRPYVVQANGAIDSFEVESATAPLWQVRLSGRGHVPLELELAGLPPGARCAWRVAGRSARVSVDGQGHVRLSSAAVELDAALLSCPAPKEDS